jgi:hypothetical protein
MVFDADSAAATMIIDGMNRYIDFPAWLTKASTVRRVELERKEN